MALVGSGAPGVFFEVTNETNTFQRARGGTICVIGITSLGKPYKQRLVTTKEQYRQYFGDIHPEDDFGFYVQRALQYGALVRVCPVAHWDSVNKVFEGVKASATLDDGTHQLKVEAASVGIGYNDVTITIADSRTSLGAFDITEQYKDAEAKTIKGVVIEQIDQINTRLEYCYFPTDNLPSNFPKGQVTLQNGAQDISKITDEDFIGKQNIGNGLYAFDGVLDSMRFFNFNRPSIEVDKAFSNYCKSRFDATFCIRPTLLDNQYWETIINYRLGNVSTLSSNSYSHAPIDNWLGTMVGGNIWVTNPNNSFDKKYTISPIADVAGLTSATDQDLGEHRAPAGLTNGALLEVTGIPDGENYGVSAKREFWNQLNLAGINMCIRTADDNTPPRLVFAYYGNESLSLASADKDPRRKANVSALIVYMMRVLMPMAKRQQFEPNDPIMWNRIYHRGRPFMQNLVANRAIFDNWQWLGDQNVSKASDAKYNDASSSTYNLKIRIVPIKATEHINIGLAANDNQSIESASVTVG